MEGTMAWHEVRGIFEAARGRRMSERRAHELLLDLLGKRVELAQGGTMAALSIITNDPSGEAGDARVPAFNRVMAVERIQVERVPKVVEWADGSLERVEVVTYRARSEPYTTRDGRRVQDEVFSGPEALKKDHGAVAQYGAATSLLARLLEPAAWQPGDVNGIAAAMMSQVGVLRDGAGEE